MCDHCGCRQGAIGELMSQHERLADLGGEVRRAIRAGEEPDARRALDALLALLEPHSVWEEQGLFTQMTAQGDFVDHVATLEAEHTSLYAAMEAADDDQRGWGRAVTEALDELDRHIYNENFGLFPGAIAVLDADDWDAIECARPATVPAGD